jgi:hypothetical protein
VNGHYTFLPWVREGAASAITTVDAPGSVLADRAKFPVKVGVNGADAAQLDVRLYGPGDVMGFAPNQVIRTEPTHLTADFEPNYLAAVEFDRPDFPWLFTPAAADSGSRLRPWLVLVVVSTAEAELAFDPTRPLPVLTVADTGASLGDLAESWAWAHAQVAGDLGGQTVPAILASNPERAIARLVCPRRLSADTSYRACVVPGFEAGRQAGLGQTPAAPVAPALGLGPAWTAGQSDHELPVYFQWEFATGSRGDFESLVALLEPRDVGGSVGIQPMDLREPGPGLPSTPAGAPGATLGFEGALVAPGTRPETWPDPPSGPFRTALRTILTAPEQLQAGDPALPGVVAPPVYGRWQSGRRTLPAARPPWLLELNLDPRYRAAAGIGTEVVRREQEALMQAAWEQVGDVERANEELRKAQLAQRTSDSLHRRFLAPMAAGELLLTAAPTAARLSMSPRTLLRHVADSALPERALAPAFRRITRPRGVLARRLDRFDQGRLVERLDAGEVLAAPPRSAPGGTVGLDSLADGVLPEPGGLVAWLPWYPIVLVVLAALLLAGALVLLIVGSVALAILLVVLAAALIALLVAARRRAAIQRAHDVMRVDELAPEALEAAPGRPDFAPRPEGDRSAPPEPGPAGADSEAAVRFRRAAVAHQRMVGEAARLARPGPAAQPLALAAIAPTVLARLEPAATVPPAVHARIEVPAELIDPDDPLGPIMAAPEFPTPMYEPLAELAQDLLVPGVESLPQNTITLLETNPRFIESYMVGLSTEMGRELLWRGYPTDQAGTYFRQFWDPRGRVPTPSTDAEREAAKDIARIHEWPAGARLGQNAGAGRPSGLLVLLIRGELLRRYPRTVVYATLADRRPDEDGRRPLEGAAAQELHPIFGGRLPPDITFLGFELRVAQARGGPAPTGGAPDPGPGWFFVLQETPTEPRFGLDEQVAAGPTPSGPGVSPWSDLAWPDVTLTASDHVAIAATLSASQKVQTLNAAATVRWGSQAADMAFISLQRPFRVALSADDMLPAA